MGIVALGPCFESGLYAGDARGHVLKCLANHADDDRFECYPSYEFIAFTAGLGRSTAAKALKELMRVGLVEKVQGGGGRRRTNRYRVNVPLIEICRDRVRTAKRAAGADTDARLAAMEAARAACEALLENRPMGGRFPEENRPVDDGNRPVDDSKTVQPMDPNLQKNLKTEKTRARGDATPDGVASRREGGASRESGGPCGDEAALEGACGEIGDSGDLAATAARPRAEGGEKAEAWPAEPEFYRDDPRIAARAAGDASRVRLIDRQLRRIVLAHIAGARRLARFDFLAVLQRDLLGADDVARAAAAISGRPRAKAESFGRWALAIAEGRDAHDNPHEDALALAEVFRGRSAEAAHARCRRLMGEAWPGSGGGAGGSGAANPEPGSGREAAAAAVRDAGGDAPPADESDPPADASAASGEAEIPLPGSDRLPETPAGPATPAHHDPPAADAA